MQYDTDLLNMERTLQLNNKQINIPIKMQLWYKQTSHQSKDLELANNHEKIFNICRCEITN
jgi:hypothetical protein